MKSDIRAAESLDGVCRFMTRYADLLFGSGCTCVRLEKNMRRMAAAFGTDLDMSILPRHLHITLRRGGESVTGVVTVKSRPISFDTIARLSRLSWRVADSAIGLKGAERAFRDISEPKGGAKRMPVLLPSLANAAFCGLFGGDVVAMAVVFLATVAGLSLKIVMSGRGADFRITTMACAFMSSVLAAADGMFSLGVTPHIAIGTSVLYLVPGIPLINSFCDMIDCHYICAFGRLMNAIVITCCLSAGICAGMLVMNVGMF